MRGSLSAASVHFNKTENGKAGSAEQKNGSFDAVIGLIVFCHVHVMIFHDFFGCTTVTCVTEVKRCE